MDLEINEFDGIGYMPVILNDGWRVAIVNSGENLLEKNLKKIERHLSSDEVFVLVSGGASLFIGKEMKKHKMEAGKVYNVKKGVWHCIAMEENSKVLIVENDDVSGRNSEYCTDLQII